MNPFEQGLKKYLNKKQLDAIRTVKIGIAGAGGLGSNCATCLARTGFRHFEIIDSDRIDASNLNRQYYFLKDTGKRKVTVLKKYLSQINPHISVKTHFRKWQQKDAPYYFKNCDIVIEAFDQAFLKRNFVECYQERASLVVSGNGMAGANVRTNLDVKKIGNVYIVGDRISDTAKGHPPLAPRVIRCASLMSEIVLNWTLTNKIKPEASFLTRLKVQ